MYPKYTPIPTTKTTLHSRGGWVFMENSEKIYGGWKASFDPTLWGGYTLKTFAATVYGMFTVGKKPCFYFDYTYNLSGYFHA